jgi:Fe2+ or Zn2+ uptake regulation protein
VEVQAVAAAEQGSSAVRGSRQARRQRAAHDEIRRLLGTADRRYTPNYQRFVDVVLAAGRPLTAEEVCGADKTLKVSTVYRVASTLIDVGALRSIPTADGVLRFELAEQLAEHHHHLICTNCGLVLDYAVSSELERAFERAAANGARKAGFEVQGHRFDVEGICADCAPS